MEVRASMPGTVATISVRLNARVQEGDTLMTVEAMKLRTPVVAPASGVVVRILVEEGDIVSDDHLLAVIEE